jgi:hypothetical protein
MLQSLRDKKKFNSKKYRDVGETLLRQNFSYLKFLPSFATAPPAARPLQPPLAPDAWPSPLLPPGPCSSAATPPLHARAQLRDLDFGFDFLPVLSEMGKIWEFRCFSVVQNFEFLDKICPNFKF